MQNETIDEWEAVMAINLRGVFFGMKHTLPHMIDRGHGRIINTASQLAHKPSPLNASYCASKAGVVALTAAVAQEVAQWGHGQFGLSWPDRYPDVAFGSGRRVETLEDRIAADAPTWPADRDRLGLRLLGPDAQGCTGQSISPNGGDVMW